MIMSPASLIYEANNKKVSPEKGGTMNHSIFCGSLLRSHPIAAYITRRFVKIGKNEETLRSLLNGIFSPHTHISNVIRSHRGTVNFGLGIFADSVNGVAESRRGTSESERGIQIRQWAKGNITAGVLRLVMDVTEREPTASVGWQKKMEAGRAEGQGPFWVVDIPHACLFG